MVEAELVLAVGGAAGTEGRRVELWGKEEPARALVNSHWGLARCGQWTQRSGTRAMAAATSGEEQTLPGPLSQAEVPGPSTCSSPRPGLGRGGLACRRWRGGS